MIISEACNKTCPIMKDFCKASVCIFWHNYISNDLQESEGICVIDEFFASKTGWGTGIPNYLYR